MEKQKRNRSQWGAIFSRLRNLGHIFKRQKKIPSPPARTITPQDSDKRASGKTALSRYLKEGTQRKLLTADEEGRLIQNLKSNDPILRARARKDLIESNTRLVISEAKRFQHRGLALDDLIQEGNIGLLAAVEDFDPKYKVRFSTYAVPKIRMHLGRAIEEKGATVRQSTRMQTNLNTVRKALDDFAKKGKTPTDQELAAKTKLSLLQIKRLRKSGKSRDVSLDARLQSSSGEQKRTLKDITTQAPDLSGVETEFHKQIPQLQQLLDQHEAVQVGKKMDNLHVLINSQLTPLEREVVLETYGFRGREGSFSKLGQKYNLSKQRIHQIHTGAMEKLRNPSLKRLIEYNKKLKAGKIAYTQG